MFFGGGDMQQEKTKKLQLRTLSPEEIENLDINNIQYEIGVLEDRLKNVC